MNREELLENLNVLLISNNEHDFEDLKKCGFKNIIYFKSIMVADKYFKEHPEDFDLFNLIIKGKQKVQRVCFHGDTDLDRKIDNKSHQIGEIAIYYYDNYTDYSLWFNYEKITSYSMQGIIDSYMANLLKDQSLCESIIEQEKVVIKTPVIPEYDYPLKKGDLKILFLVSGFVYANKIEKSAEKLGVNVRFVPDNNNALGLEVIHNMGNYDIIIASKGYSGNLIEMNEELTEQGRLTGRKLGLVVTYENDSIFDTSSDDDFTFDYLGYEVKYLSALGGVDAQNKDVSSDQYRVLHNEGYKPAMSIIEHAIDDYHKELKLINGIGLEDVNVEEFTRYKEEYDEADKSYEQDKKDYKDITQLYDNIVKEAKKYLKNKRKGLIKTSLVELDIRESNDGIIINSLMGQRIICSLTVTKNEENPNRIFYLQTIKENGTISAPTELSLHPIEKKYDVSYPNEKQIRALSGLWKKIERNLKPINDSFGDQAPKRKNNNPHKKVYSY